jgi:hypothetical protein
MSEVAAAPSHLYMADVCPAARFDNGEHARVDSPPLPTTQSMKQHITYIGGSTIFSFIDPDASAMPEEQFRARLLPSHGSEATAPVDMGPRISAAGAARSRWLSNLLSSMFS